MTRSFGEYIKASVDAFHAPSDAADLDEALKSHSESRVADLDLGRVRAAYPDLDEVVPEAKGVAAGHPAFAAAIEVAIQDAVHLDLGTSHAPGR